MCCCCCCCCDLCVVSHKRRKQRKRPYISVINAIKPSDLNTLLTLVVGAQLSILKILSLPNITTFMFSTFLLLLLVFIIASQIIRQIFSSFIHVSCERPKRCAKYGGPSETGDGAMAERPHRAREGMKETRQKSNLSL